MLALAAARRLQYAGYQPVFWRPAAGAVDRQRPHFQNCIADEAVLSLVADTGSGLAGFAIGTFSVTPPVTRPVGPRSVSNCCAPCGVAPGNAERYRSSSSAATSTTGSGTRYERAG